MESKYPCVTQVAVWPLLACLALAPAPLALAHDPQPCSGAWGLNLSLSLSLTNPELVAGPLLRGSVGRVIPTRTKEPLGLKAGRSVGLFRPGRKSPLAVGWVGRSGRSESKTW